MLRSLVQQGLYRPGAPAAEPAPATAPARGAGRHGRSAQQHPHRLRQPGKPRWWSRNHQDRSTRKDFTERGNIQLYTLKNARASSLATVLEQFFRAKRAARSRRRRRAPSAASRWLVIRRRRPHATRCWSPAGKESFDVMERMIQQLDGEEMFARMNFQVFPLKQATASKLQDTLQQSVRPPAARGSRRALRSRSPSWPTLGQRPDHRRVDRGHGAWSRR